MLLAAWPAAAAAPFSDKHLSQIALAQLQQASGDGNYGHVGNRITGAMVQRLSLGPIDRQVLCDMMFVARACHYLPTVEKLDGGKDAAAFLVTNPDIARRLFRAMEDTRNRDGCLKNFVALWKASPKKVLEMPDLAVAFATAAAAKPPQAQENQADLVESFSYFADGSAAWRCDLKAMPFELARYLADTRLAIDQRKWAAQKYARQDPLGKIYFDIKYDDDAYLKSVPKRIAKLDYTLQNILQVGGVCMEQAYFASETSKALGLPATIVYGKSNVGIGHAWLAILKVSRSGRSIQYEWDTSVGRYEDSMFLSGYVRDAATGMMVSDSDLFMAAAGANMPVASREEADAAAGLAFLLTKLKLPAEGDVSALTELAGAYNDLPTTKVKVDASAIKPKRKVEAALAEELITQAVSAHVGHKQSWLLAVSLHKDDKISESAITRILDLLINKTGKVQPDYSCHLLLQIVPGMDSAVHRERICQKAFAFFAARPDLQGRIAIALADDLLEQGKKAEALRAYENVMNGKSGQFAELVIASSRKAEGILVADGKLDTAIKMYDGLFAKARKEKITIMAYHQTAHYRLGKRLAALLEQAGKRPQAAKVLGMIGESGG